MMINGLFQVLTNGQWSPWGDFSSCTKTCGTGTRGRSRTCASPALFGDGKNCVGSSVETEICNIHVCSVVQIPGRLN